MSRRETLEEKKSLQKSYFFIAGGIFFLALFLVIGIPLLVDFSAFLSSALAPKATAKKKVEKYLQQPQLEIPYEATNSAQIKISGFGAQGTEAEIFVNNYSFDKKTVDKNGDFSFSGVTLAKGSNEIYVVTKDPSSDKEVKSEIVTVTYDKDAPKIEFDNLTDGQEFRLNNLVTFKGKLNEEGSLYLNDRYVMVNSDKTFSTDFQLNDGENKLTFLATDKAGNQTKKEMTVKFTK